ncbi:YhcN/YlaJ family sporulation lipoprotein [Neobacillus mesonae]|uniref:YhcN/YlaJ family sporulation lipoprotein n=1 Tax=Neobacillus mesonae TaxID=1193713 RepID=UPI002042562C|nr:YhcN/YlaJ family sporulation lipoprotein [Neobacillus mesonae]MCM3568418.1 YhcN/YlaJ family sporulation lipoprotein [Neobacillus mesonae]
MNRKQWMIPLSALMIVGASGCANNDSKGVNDSNNNPARPIGYYSNENHPDSNNAFNRDNDGPFTEMMDHNLGDEDQNIYKQRRDMLQTRDENGHPVNPTKPLAKTDRNFFQRDNRFSTSDMNYHGHLNRDIANMGSAVDHEYQEDITNVIRNKVADVNNVRSIRNVSYGNSVWISVALNDDSRAAAVQTKRAIKKAVQPYVKGKTIKVIVDEGMFGRDRNINNDFPQKTPRPYK